MKNKLLQTNIEGVKLVSQHEKWLIPSIILNALFGNLAPYLTIYMSALIVNEIAGARDMRKLITLVIITIAADLAIVILGAIFRKIKNHKWQSFDFAEKRMFMQHGFALDYEHLENTEVRQRRRKIDESGNINEFGIWAMLYSFMFITNDIVNVILSVAFMSSLFVIIIEQASMLNGVVIYPLAILLLLVLSITITFINQKKLGKFSDELSNTMIGINRVAHGYHDNSIGKDVRIYNMGGIYEQHQKELIHANHSGFKKYWYGYRNAQIPDQIISQAINFTIYAFVCLNAVRGLFEIGSVIMYVGFISRLVGAFKGLSDNISMFRSNLPFLRHYLDFFKIENKMYQGTLPVEKRDDNEYEIEFHNVSFKYPLADVYALKNLNLKLNIGKRMAVVGMNGSGKTTMIKLLCRLYDPTEGEITLNGVDIKKYRYNEYMNVFSVVFQDFKLFSFGLGQNVATNVDVDKDKAVDSLNKAGFAERLSTMPKGLDTPMYKDFDEDGVEISGGEAQKIALARALYKNAPFIVLDEPTAALDPIAEYEIYSKFNEIVGDKTAVYISHRLSSCRFCDDIAVFHEGELIQRGSHDTLIADTRGKYCELWNAQAQYYSENAAAS